MDSLAHSAKILLIDDTKEVREAFRALLESEGYDFYEASNGMDGIKKATKLKPDLIFLDVMMPEMDGFETCKRLRATKVSSNTPIIMVTALDDKESKIKGLSAGADDFISKPIDTLVFKARVKTITNLNRAQKLKQSEIDIQNTLDQTVDLLTDLMSLTVSKGLDDKRVVQIIIYLAKKLKIPNGNELRYAVQLMNIGKLALPVDLLTKHRMGEVLTSSETLTFNSYIKISKSLTSKIKGFERVSEIISYSSIIYIELQKIKPSISHPAFLGHLIYCATAFDEIILNGKSPKDAELDMLKMSNNYHPKIVNILKHATPVMYESTPSIVDVSGLRIGMLCHEDLVSLHGVAILKKGEVINQVNLEKIMVFKNSSGLKEPFSVIKRLTTGAAPSNIN
jgi:DNA-binding response OmpR family regulator